MGHSGEVGGEEHDMKMDGGMNSDVVRNSFSVVEECYQLTTEKKELTILDILIIWSHGLSR